MFWRWYVEVPSEVGDHDDFDGLEVPLAVAILNHCVQLGDVGNLPIPYRLQIQRNNSILKLISLSNLPESPFPPSCLPRAERRGTAGSAAAR